MRTLVSTVLTLALAVTAPGAAPASQGAARPPAAKACTACVEKGAVLDPATVPLNGYFGAKARAAYVAARRYPATIDRLHCFCECQENAEFKHKSLLTCFTSDHAAHCGICIEEALMAAGLKKQGMSDEEVERWVEDTFRLDGHKPTPGR